jgi:hypothetical protein
MLSVITALELFQHYFAKMDHRNTSCDPHLHPSHQATNAPLGEYRRPALVEQFTVLEGALSIF